MIQLTQAEAAKIFTDESDKYTVIEELEWEDQGKWSILSVIFREGDGPYYELVVNRTGTYFDGYDFEYSLECEEVKQVETITKTWKPV